MIQSVEAHTVIGKKVVLPRPVGTNCSGPARLSDLTARPVLPSRYRIENDFAIGSRKSKFFNGSSRGHKGITKWPSGEGLALAEMEPELVWEKSDEAGPEVDIESPVRKNVDGRGRVMSSPMRLQSPVATSSKVVEMDFSSPVPLRKRSRTGSPEVADTSQLDSPHGPDLSSPLAGPASTYSSAVRPYTLSSPPDVGRERSMTADPFSPSPSPRALATAPIVESTQVIPETQEKRSQPFSRPGQRSSWPTVDTPTFSQTPTKRGARGPQPISNLVLIPTSSSSPAIPTPRADPDGSSFSSRQRLRRAKLELGVPVGTSSDSVQEEEDLVTPSFDIGRNRPQGNKKRRRNSDVKNEKSDISDDGEDVVLVEEEEEELVLREEGRRAERAKVVALGWRDKFALKSGSVGGGTDFVSFSWFLSRSHL